MTLPQEHAASGVLGTVMMGLYDWIEHFAPLAEENIDFAEDLSEVVYFYEVIIWSLVSEGITSLFRDSGWLT